MSHQPGKSTLQAGNTKIILLFPEAKIIHLNFLTMRKEITFVMWAKFITLPIPLHENIDIMAYKLWK